MASKASKTTKKELSPKSEATETQVSLAMLTTLLEEHRSTICADHRLAISALESMIDSMQLVVSDHRLKIISPETGLNSIWE